MLCSRTLSGGFSGSRYASLGRRYCGKPLSSTGCLALHSGKFHGEYGHLFGPEDTNLLGEGGCCRDENSQAEVCGIANPTRAILRLWVVARTAFTAFIRAKIVKLRPQSGHEPLWACPPIGNIRSVRGPVLSPSLLTTVAHSPANSGRPFCLTYTLRLNGQTCRF